MNTLNALKEYYSDSTVYARKWKEQGGKVIGYFCNVVPEEMIIAAGFLPVRVTVGPGADMRKAGEKMGRAEGFALSMAGRVISGEYDFLDYLVVPHARGSVHKMYSVFRDMKKADSEGKIPELFFLDHAHARYMTSRNYNRDRMLEFAEKLAEWSGAPLDEEALKSACELTNQTRELITEFAKRRAEGTISVTGAEALAVIGASMFMDKKEYNGLLEDLLNEPACTAGGRPGAADERASFSDESPDAAEALPRVYFAGCPQYGPELYELLESCGCRVIAENHCMGNRAGEDPVIIRGNVLEDIIHRYNTMAPCPSTPPLTGRVDYFKACVEKAKPDAVVFFSPRGDAEAWDIPDEKAVLDAVNIPHIYFEKQKGPVGDPEEIRSRMAEFLSAVKGGSPEASKTEDFKEEASAEGGE